MRSALRTDVCCRNTISCVYCVYVHTRILYRNTEYYVYDTRNTDTGGAHCAELSGVWCRLANCDMCGAVMGVVCGAMMYL